jgi:hypothetical protein
VSGEVLSQKTTRFRTELLEAGGYGKSYSKGQCLHDR